VPEKGSNFTSEDYLRWAESVLAADYSNPDYVKYNISKIVPEIYAQFVELLGSY